jgi:hypothetical protein
MTLPTVASPPLSPSQINFLALHIKYHVERWQWHFSDCALRAYTPRRTATIWRDELDALMEMGLMFKGAGCADVHATDLGRSYLGALESR